MGRALSKAILHRRLADSQPHNPSIRARLFVVLRFFAAGALSAAKTRLDRAAGKANAPGMLRTTRPKLIGRNQPILSSNPGLERASFKILLPKASQLAASYPILVKRLDLRDSRIQTEKCRRFSLPLLASVDREIAVN